MAGFVKGDVVIVPFPFSDLSQTKRRPALVLATLRGDDLILCQITSRSVSDGYAIVIETTDFSSGSLNQSSNIRPNRLFTADRQLILRKAGELKPEKLDQAIARLVELFAIVDAIAGAKATAAAVRMTFVARSASLQSQPLTVRALQDYLKP